MSRIEVALSGLAVSLPAALKAGFAALVVSDCPSPAPHSLEQSFVGEKKEGKCKHEDEQWRQQDQVPNQCGRDQDTKCDDQLDQAEEHIAPALNELKPVQLIEPPGIFLACRQSTSSCGMPAHPAAPRSPSDYSSPFGTMTWETREAWISQQSLVARFCSLNLAWPSCSCGGGHRRPAPRRSRLRRCWWRGRPHAPGCG